MPNFDYIIIGAGASGLLLADAMGNDDFFDEKSILLLDKDDKKKNDRTWCFWEKNKGAFDEIVHKQWPKFFFAGETLRQSTNIAPYSYKMLRGLDFYDYYLNKIGAHPNITLMTEEVIDVRENESGVSVTTGNTVHTAKQVFNSIFNYENILKQQQYPVLQQHFVGWFIKTEHSVFKPEEATFMDFSIPQKENTRFMYVLPFSENEALVEYTLFSEKVLSKTEYEQAIKDYLQDLDTGGYTIIETERGNIPMTCYDFASHNTDNILHIGIAGGWAKPSTGFTFYNATKQVRKLADYLKKEKPLSKFSRKSRFWFYDLLFVDVLFKQNELGRSVFESLFKKRNTMLVLKFLDEDTSFWQDLKVIWACPKRPFLRALSKRMVIYLKMPSILHSSLLFAYVS